MSKSAIKVENLGKSYLVGHNTASAERYTALRDVIARSAKSGLRKTRDLLTGRPIVQGDEVEEFWALKDIDFEVNQGDRVGIIGRNGAGKSTLLKVLSRITEPTRGRVTITGRVASLLEVGTGFHPELSGRENIFLNGAILGMSRKDIQRKFDEIVDFAEVERFLDTPVKRYSSGMYVRLAFAVAAHLEPEILVVDEVLAVGDAQFQKKCLGKMEDVAQHGRTVLFVSHNMGAIKSLCEKSILLVGGRLSQFGDTESVLSDYYRNDRARTSDKVLVDVHFDSDRSHWAPDDELVITIRNNGFDPDSFVDVAFYDEFRTRLFSIEGAKFERPRKLMDGLSYKIKNPGLVNTTILVDVALKKHAHGSYESILFNVLEISTEQTDTASPISGPLRPMVEF